jgi:hypothetical protein
MSQIDQFDLRPPESHYDVIHSPQRRFRALSRWEPFAVVPGSLGIDMRLTGLACLTEHDDGSLEDPHLVRGIDSLVGVV